MVSQKPQILKQYNDLTECFYPDTTYNTNEYYRAFLLCSPVVVGHLVWDKPYLRVWENYKLREESIANWMRGMCVSLGHSPKDTKLYIKHEMGAECGARSSHAHIILFSGGIGNKDPSVLSNYLRQSWTKGWNKFSADRPSLYRQGDARIEPLNAEKIKQGIAYITKIEYSYGRPVPPQDLLTPKLSNMVKRINEELNPDLI